MDVSRSFDLIPSFQINNQTDNKNNPQVCNLLKDCLIVGTIIAVAGLVFGQFALLTYCCGFVLGIRLGAHAIKSMSQVENNIYNKIIINMINMLLT